jgi:hypothetical protein
MGSVLEPLLFLFYINDLPPLVKSKTLPIIFADDTSFIISNSDPVIMDQDAKVILQTVQRWFNSNRMLLNYNKTKFMQFLPNVNHQPLDTIEINTCKIYFANSFKFLGVIIESSLTWKEHIDYINLKLNSQSYMVRSLRPVLELTTLKLLYFCYVLSVLNYGIMFWGNSPHSKSVFLTQERIVRTTMEAKPKDSCKEWFSKVGILTLYSQYIFFNSCVCRKA